jgi:NCS2 family nucleobase:cation symporter-2
MASPTNLLYGVSDRPPAVVCLLNAAQHVTVMAPTLVYPILVMRAGGASEDAIIQVVSLSFVALGIATAMQSLTHSQIGSGYLLPFTPTAAYVPASLAAMKLGGMPMVFGMTLLAGFFEIALAQVIRRMRPYFPAEISGLCVLLIGTLSGILGVRLLLGLDASGAVRSLAAGRDFALGIVTLAVMIGLNVWSTGSLKMYCAIIGIIVGYVGGIILNAVDASSLQALQSARIMDFPQWPAHLPSFSIDLVIPFMIGALACCLRAMGDITTCQKINDRDWVRPGLTSIRNGVVADGAGTIAAGLIGGLGGNTYSSSVGMSSAVGVTARVVGFWIGGLLLLLSFFPIFAAFLVSIPGPVMGAAVIFTACFVLIKGLQIITDRLLDARRTFIVGLALTLSLSRDIFPSFYRGLPEAIQPFVGSSLIIGLLTALILNAVFRIGVRSRETFVFNPGVDDHDVIRGFLEQQGAKWGARRDVIERAIFGTAQAIESIADDASLTGPVEVEASFDEFNLDIRLNYQGEVFVIEDRRPTDDEIRDTEDGIRRLAGYLIRQNADSVRSSRKGDRSVLEFHFQH